MGWLIIVNVYRLVYNLFAYVKFFSYFCKCNPKNSNQ